MLHVHQISKSMQQSLLKSGLNSTLCNLIKFSVFTTNQFNGEHENNKIDHFQKIADKIQNENNKPESAEETAMLVNDDSKLQPQWVSLERRVLNRKSNIKMPSGRHNLFKSAWDHENV